MSVLSGAGVCLVMCKRTVFGLTQFTFGSIAKTAIVQLSGIDCLSPCVRSCMETRGNVISKRYFLCTTYVCMYLWLWQSDLDGIELTGMASPHPPLTITESSLDQQREENCVHLP